MKRTFIAFDITASDAVKEVFDSVRQKLHGERINWVNPDHFHITLKFLGDTEEEKIQLINEIISETLIPFSPFEVSLAGLGIFRNIHDPQVLWMGCRVDETLKEFRANLDSALSSLGYETEKRPFLPHLTLGRIKLLRHTHHISEILAAHKDKEFQRIHITGIIYYESILRSSGPEYKSIREFIVRPSQS